MTTLDTPVSKAIAQRLKNVGFDAKTTHYYKYEISMMSAMRVDHNTHHDRISAPTISEVIEWMDDKGVYVVPCRFDGAWGIDLITDSGIEIFVGMYDTHPTRQSAYISGIKPACEFLKSKMSKNGR